MMSASGGSDMALSQLTQPSQPEESHPLSESERVRQTLRARRREPLPAPVAGSLVVQKDNSMTGLLSVAQKCLQAALTPEDVMDMGDAVVPLFFGSEFFRLGATLADMGAEWGRLLTAVLENHGSDPLGCFFVLQIW